MADINNLSNFLTDVADAIRSKKNTTDLIPASEFDTEILSIKGGDSEQIVSQLASQVTGVRIKPSTAGTVKIQWDIPDDETYAGVDISWATERTPTFPINEKNIISIDSSIIDSTLIEGLEPSTLYGFIVMAKNKDGLRNTTKSSNNTAMGYVSEMMDYIEVDVMENYTRFEKSNVVNDFIICSATVASGYPGCYKLNVTTGEWELIYETKSNFRILDPNLDTGDIILIARETSSNWPGFYYYDLTTNEMIAVNENSNMYQIYYRGKTDNIVYLSTNNGTYTFDIITKEFVKLSFSNTLQAIVYDTPVYLYFSDQYDGLYKYNKNTKVVTELVKGSNNYAFWDWKIYTSQNGDKFIMSPYTSSGYDTDVDMNSSVFRISPITYDVSSSIATTDTGASLSGKCTEIDNSFIYLGSSSEGFYRYDFNTQVITPIPYNIRASGRYDFTRAIAYDNEYFVVAADPTIVNEDDTTSSLGVGAVMKYDKTNNVVDMVYQSSITTASSQSSRYADVYPTKTKLFIRISNKSNMEILVYDITTKEISLAFSGTDNWIITVAGSDTDENEVLLLRYSSAGTSYRFNPETNMFDIALTSVMGTAYTGYIISDPPKWYNISGATSVNILTGNSGNIGTYYFDSDHNLHKISDTSGYNTLLDGEYEAFLIHATANTYKYDKVSKSFSPMENVGGTQLTENSFFYKSINQLNIYNYNGETKNYSALEGDYAAATVTANKGYVHSTASNKLLVALTSFDFVIKNKDVFVTIDKTGKIYHSIDGETWVYKTQLDVESVDNICYGNNMFVAGCRVSYYVQFWYSYDGIIWTQGTHDERVASAANIVYGNNCFVALVGKHLFKSTDGISWVHKKEYNTNLHAISFGTGVFVVAHDNYFIDKSVDGETWGLVANLQGSSNPYIRGLKFANDKFIVWCSNYDRNIYTPRYSYDGDRWVSGATLNDVTTGSTIDNVCYGNNLYFATKTNSNELFTSSDGVNWTQSTVNMPCLVKNMIFAKERFVVLGMFKNKDDDNYYHYGAGSSIDGLTWTEATGLEDSGENYALACGEIPTI